MLTPYWFEFSGFSSGYGVTAHRRHDALNILRHAVFGGELPPTTREIENVDVSELDASIRLDMWPPAWRGIWFPRGYGYFATPS